MGTAVGLLLAEGVSRFVFHQNIESIKSSETDLYYYYDPSGVRRHIPGKTGHERMWNNQGKAEFRINSHGFRGKEFDPKKPPGVTRVLFLGDSITLGGRLPEEAIFVEQIQKSLNSNGSRRFEVANAGVGDIGLTEEIEILKTSGLAFQPDLIVLCWFLNDGRPPVGFPEEVIYRNPFIRWFNSQEWLRKSYFIGFLYDKIRQYVMAKQLKLMDSENRRFQWAEPYNERKWVAEEKAFAQLIDAAKFDWGDAWNQKSRERMFEQIRELKDFANKNRTQFALVALPVSAQLIAKFQSSLINEPQRDLKSFCLAEKIPFLDLLPSLRKHLNEQIYYDHCHYTPRGNQVVAESILRFLRESNLI